MSRAYLVAVTALAGVVVACSNPTADNRPADERWADKVCSALVTWSSAQSSGQNAGLLKGLMDDGRLTRRTMINALRPGAAADRGLRTAVRDAGPPPVPDSRSLSRKLDAMVDTATVHVQRAYDIARDSKVSVLDAYWRIQVELGAVDGALAHRGIVNMRWGRVDSCEALI